MKFNAGSGGSFLKINDKESVIGLFRGDPYEFRQHWENKKGILCEGDECRHCLEDDKKNAMDGGKRKPSFRFRINFVLYDVSGDWKMNIIEQGWNFYNDLKALHEGDYNLERTLVKITRNGTGNMTKYTILPVNRLITDQDMERIAAVKLLPMDKHEAAPPRQEMPPQMTHRNHESSFAPPMHADDIPF